jgi:hypothetical protein
LALGAVAAVALVLVSGGTGADPRTPAGLPGMPPPFLGTAVAGDGGMTAAVDAYGDVVDLRAPGPAGRALIDNPSARQAAGTVAADTGIVPRVSIDGGSALPLWRADSVSQRHLPGTNVVRTTARFGRVRVTATEAVLDWQLAVIVRAAGAGAQPSLSVNVAEGARCRREAGGNSASLRCSAAVPLSSARRFLEGGAPDADSGPKPELAGTGSPGELVARAAEADRAWLAAARPLGEGAPSWARRMYARSLLTLRALTDRRTGAVAAGARDGWAYVWPRDAATAALALVAAGYRPEARRVVGFLTGIDSSARFHGNGSPVAGREAQGDAAGWIRLAAAAFGLDAGFHKFDKGHAPDYQEGSGGVYLGNVLSLAGDAARLPATSVVADGLAPGIREAFGTRRGLIRKADDPGSGLDSAAAWAVRPFSIPPLYGEVRRTLLRLVATGTRFGITPGEGWTGGVDPWTAPTAWTAWAFAALADAQHRDPVGARTDHRQALRLLADLRRAATPAGSLPERVDARTGVPRSTTPLAWSHAFAILALRQLWPGLQVL